MDGEGNQILEMVNRMGEIKVSIIIPIYNAEKTLRRCIGSVCSQTLKEIEIICVDDGSSDGSMDLLVELAKTDCRINVIRQENQCAGVARNRGIDAAKGRYVTFIDADDVYCSEKVLKSLYNKANTKDADMIKGRFHYIDYNTKKVFADDFSCNSGIGMLLGRKPEFRKHPDRFIHAADVPWNGLYRREFLLENKIEFNRLICVNDHSFYIHCLLKAEHIIFVKTQTVLYTINQTESLVSQKPKHFTAQLQSFEIVDELCRNELIEVRRAIMLQEIIGVFSLYGKLDSISQEKYQIQLAEFLCKIDEDMVGKDFLDYFEWAELYSKLRYNVPVKRLRYSAVKRLKYCIREHGFAYACRLFIEKLNFFQTHEK